MDLGLAVQIGTLVSIVAGVIGLVVGVRIYRRQTNTQIFLEYTKRYQEVMDAFPPDARRARLAMTDELPDPSAELSIAVLRYLNLCSEEFYLWKRGYLASEVWSIWQDELRRTLASPIVRREWPSLQSEFASYPAFYEYVERAQAQAMP